VTLRVGLIELPAFKLLDEGGLNWTALRQREPLGSKQVLAAHLTDLGMTAELVNLKAVDDERETGTVEWRGRCLSKVAVGADWNELDPKEFDVWGLTVNYFQEREIAGLIVQHLREGGGRVIVGGSDAFEEPEWYVEAGADAVVCDKSGAANLGVVEHVARGSTESLTGVMLADGTRIRPARPPMSPEAWPLPDQGLVRETLGTDYWEAPLPEELLPIGGVMLDIGCDRHCDFCETPTYGLGYRKMAPERAIEWLRRQREAGARSVIILSDQFLGRVLWDGGREDVIEIMTGLRDLGLAVLWGNGLELKKATKGRSLPNGDPAPDLELVEALWGWDGSVGCAQAYIPAERPTAGTTAYQKLLPWQDHVAMLEALVRAGLPDINYGVIVGLPDDTHESLATLYEAVAELRAQLKDLNPELRFRVTPYAIRPLPGTPQSRFLRENGLLVTEDPAILGGFWTACANTFELSYEEISDWQSRLIHELSDVEEDWQGITALAQTASIGG
jgi:hypothetical protein